jgi:hypothetical protein
MQIASLHADARADERVRARPDLAERRLVKYQRRFRPQVLSLAARHPRLKDLALSFPALLFAVAVPRPGYDCEHVCARVIAGAPLRELAALTQLPLWLRRLPPEAFGGAIPPLPDGAFVSRQIVNYIPRSPSLMQAWLENIANAWAWAGDAVAVWIARELRLTARTPARENLRPICLWAWYSMNGLVNAPDVAWTPAMKIDAARPAARTWVQRLAFRFMHSGANIRDMWLEPGVFDGFAFVPLDTFEAITAEGAAMQHCVASYVAKISRDQCRIWSVQRDGLRVATAEVCLPWDGPVPYVMQLKAKSNASLPVDVWLAVRAWLAVQDIARLHPDGHRRVPPPDRKLWIESWRPYWLAKRRFPGWLPLAPSRRAVNCLSAVPGRRRN